MAAIEHRRIRAGRCDWHVAVAGSGPPLLLVHGWPEFWAVWEKQIERLADRFSLYVPDLPGFGETPDPNGGRPSDSLGADALADEIAALLAALGLSQVGLVTHDVGGSVAQSLGLRMPELLSKIFLFNCPMPFIGQRWRDASHIPEIWYQTFNQQPWAAEVIGSSAANCRLYIGAMLRHWAYRPDAFSEADIDRWVEAYMRPGNLQGGFNWYRAAAPARLAAMAGTIALPPKIKVPAYSFWGRYDPVLKSAWSELLPEAFETVEVSLSEAGHFPHWEVPDETAARIAGFFEH